MERRIFCTLCFTCGILLPQLSATQIVVVLALVFLTSLWREKLRTPLALTYILLCLALGCGRCWWDLRESGEPLPSKAEVVGTIADSPRRWGSSAVFFLEVQQLDDEDLDRPLKLLVQWRGCEQSLAPGDVWRLSGKLTKGRKADYPGGFDQRFWLWSQGARASLVVGRFDTCSYVGPPQGFSAYQLSFRAREHMMRNLTRIDEPDARALVVGVVFGETQSLPKELQEQFRRTGTSHLLAASGMNVALLAGLILGAGKLLGFGPWRVAPWAIPAVIGYAFLAGCAPSITRAATGTTLALIAMWIGRTSGGWNTLCLSIWCMLWWDPRQIHDLGFQLSAMAVVALLRTPEPPQCWGKARRALLLTASVSLVTLPLFWHSFGEVSTTILPANLVLGPIVELLFPLGLLASVFPISPLIWANLFIARISLILVSWFSSLADPLPLAQPRLLTWLILFAAIALWFSFLNWKKRNLAWVLLALALISGYYCGMKPFVTDSTALVRRIGHHKPVYWVSTENEEMLVLSGDWQRYRAQQMMRKLGSLREPRILVLDESETFSFQMGDFEWKTAGPLLLKAPYTEVRIRSGSYEAHYWRP